MIFLQAAAKSTGPAAALLELAEIGAIELLVSDDTLEELQMFWIAQVYSESSLVDSNSGTRFYRASKVILGVLCKHSHVFALIAIRIKHRSRIFGKG